MPDSAQIVGVVKRRQVNAVLNSLEHLISDRGGLREQFSAIHHAVSGGVDVT